MTIAVNLTKHSGTFESAYIGFMIESIRQVASEFPQHQFSIIANYRVLELENVENITVTVIDQPNKNALKKISYSLKVYNALNQKSIDCIISAINNFSGKIKKKQHVFVGNDIVKHISQKEKKSIGNILQKAASIITLGESIQKQIETLFPEYSLKITHTSLLLNPDYLPVHWKRKEEIKEKFTAEKEYFFIPASTSAIPEIKNILLAFSIFKKMQKTGMKLMIATSEENISLTSLLKNYKYRSDVICVYSLNTEELYEKMASAYAVLTISDDTILHTLNSMQAGVPVITCQSDFAKSIFGEDVLYYDNTHVKTIADQLMLLFKDEGKRTELIEQSVQRASTYQNKTTAISCWNKILS
jgi:glycosyltransferase involved in cell wall biosynthesis